MKTIKRETQIINTYFQCDICKKEYFMPEEAIRCELSHTCTHDPGFAIVDLDSWVLNIGGITSSCKLCGLRLGHVSFKGIKNKENLIKDIYKLVKQEENGK